MSLSPIVNAGLLYVNNGQVAQTGNTTCTIASGQVRDSTNTFDISWSSTITISASANGINGLDVGSLAASTFYAVYVIADPLNEHPVAGIVSTSTSTPTLPLGYAIWRRLGWMLTDGSSHFLPFWVAGSGGGRFIMWDAPIRVLNGGTATTLTEVSLATAIPNITNPAVEIAISAAYTPNSASNVASLIPFGSGASAGLGTAMVAIKASGAAQIVLPPFRMTSGYDVTNGYQALKYAVASSDSLTLYVNGFTDLL